MTCSISTTNPQTGSTLTFSKRIKDKQLSLIVQEVRRGDADKRRKNDGLITLYDYTSGEKVVLESFDNWLDAEKTLDAFKKNNPGRSGFIAGKVKGKLKINNEGCPVNIMDLIGL